MSLICLYAQYIQLCTVCQEFFSKIRGIISTYSEDDPLVIVWGGIYKAEGDTSDYNNEYTMTLQPEKRSFNLSELDYYLAFGSLPVGDYVYRVEAVPAENESKPERSPKTADGLNPLRLALISVVCVLGVLGIRKLHRNPSLPR